MKLALSGKRVIGYGENLIPMGGTVIDTDTNKVYQNATIAECDGCPSDIDLVGYEYHAGNFVPCAPYGTEDSGGEIMVACDNCATPRKSGIDIQDVHDAGKLSRGTLSSDRLPTVPVAKGGTGRSTLTADSFLAGNGTAAVKLLTPTEVLTKIGAAKSDHTHNYLIDAGVASSDKKIGLQYSGNGASSCDWIPVYATDTDGYYAVLKPMSKANMLSALGALPLSGGEMTGDLTMNGATIASHGAGGARYIGSRTDGAWTYLFGDTLTLGSENMIYLYPYWTQDIGGFFIGGETASNGAELKPNINGRGRLGSPSSLLKEVWATNGTINTSDERLKQNVKDISSDMEKVFMDLRPVSFDFIDLADGIERTGFIAQEVVETLKKHGFDPEKTSFVGKYNIDPESDRGKIVEDDHIYGMNNEQLIAPCVMMIQKQQAEIEDLKSENNTLKSEITKIKEHLGIL